MLAEYDRPWFFHGMAALTAWVFWLVAAWLSRLPGDTLALKWGITLLSFAGLAAPVAVAAWLIRDRPDLRHDIRARLFWPRGVPARYIVLAAFLLPASALAAIAISLLFGADAAQFQLRDGYTFTSSLVPVWVILLLAPILEELAWHSYGTDALVSRMPLLWASLVFAVFWMIWHVPLSFIDGYYHAELVEAGWLATINFPLSLIPFVLLMNWLYYRTGRSILVAILFHTAAGFGNEMFSIAPDTKIFQTLLLVMLSAWVIGQERDLFCSRLVIDAR